ncbi:hypothetical protein [Gynuella sunshinyii]|uniref:Uncharacterized protein n=1 Tax=Gynuella sunshinyii YC6258 TaxID=1445510 RepID=A0A0C5VUQ7_9GAMM|nr:hypothetical protein [Gynuella sunshinyii]AJQ97038.1 hypothetical Protein YC6258_05006 [Gynuella sunshinyii YC6258]
MIKGELMPAGGDVRTECRPRRGAAGCLCGSELSDKNRNYLFLSYQSVALIAKPIFIGELNVNFSSPEAVAER